MHLLLAQIQLVPDGTIFIHIALILLMIWILNRTLYKPLNTIIAARDNSKGGHSSEAEGILKDAGVKEALYTKELLETRSSGYELIEKEQKQAAAERDKSIAEAKANAASRLAEGRAELQGQSTAARAAMTTEAEKIADSIAASILKS